MTAPARTPHQSATSPQEPPVTAPGNSIAVVPALAGLDISALPPTLTPEQVGAIFNVDPKTVTRWAKADKLIAIETLGGHRRYPARQAPILKAIQAIVNAGATP